VAEHTAREGKTKKVIEFSWRTLNGRQYLVLLEQTKEQFYSDLRERECDVGRTKRSCRGLV